MFGGGEDTEAKGQGEHATDMSTHRAGTWSSETMWYVVPCLMFCTFKDTQLWCPRFQQSIITHVGLAHLSYFIGSKWSLFFSFFVSGLQLENLFTSLVTIYSPHWSSKTRPSSSVICIGWRPWYPYLTSLPITPQPLAGRNSWIEDIPSKLHSKQWPWSPKMAQGRDQPWRWLLAMLDNWRASEHLKARSTEEAGTSPSSLGWVRTNTPLTCGDTPPLERLWPEKSTVGGDIDTCDSEIYTHIFLCTKKRPNLSIQELPYLCAPKSNLAYPPMP